MLTTPAQPNEGLVFDVLKTKVVAVVAIPIEFTQSHRFATVLTSMKGVRGSNANFERGVEGRSFCRCENVIQAKARRRVK